MGRARCRRDRQHGIEFRRHHHQHGERDPSGLGSVLQGHAPGDRTRSARGLPCHLRRSGRCRRRQSGAAGLGLEQGGTRLHRAGQRRGLRADGGRIRLARLPRTDRDPTRLAAVVARPAAQPAAHVAVRDGGVQLDVRRRAVRTGACRHLQHRGAGTAEGARPPAVGPVAHPVGIGADPEGPAAVASRPTAVGAQADLGARLWSRKEARAQDHAQAPVRPGRLPALHQPAAEIRARHRGLQAALRSAARQHDVRSPQEGAAGRPAGALRSTLAGGPGLRRGPAR